MAGWQDKEGEQPTVHLLDEATKQVSQSASKIDFIETRVIDVGMVVQFEG